MLETAHNHGLVCQKMRTDTSFLTANMSHSAFAESNTMETFHPDMTTYVKSCTGTRSRMSKWCSHIVVSRSSWSVLLLGRRGQLFFVDSRFSCSSWLVIFRGQSFFLVVVVSLLRDQSFFVLSRLDRRGQSFFAVSRSSWSLLSVFFVISRSTWLVVLIVVVSRSS